MTGGATLLNAPMAQWLGLSVEKTGDSALYRLSFDEKHIGNPAIRALHGGVIAAFLEVCAQIELAAGLAPDATLKTVNVDIDYLASSKAQDMLARASVLRLGRRIAFVEATGWQEDETRPVAKARCRIRIGAQK